MSCDACNGIQQRNRKGQGHAKLTPIGEPVKVRNMGQPAVIMTHYVCEDCGTKWQHEDDKRDAYAGWSIEI
ncbi:hypothetical protein [Glaciimonas soli]|uniref:Uncharacterized protein n=1 Tax=Glaciimonas soli TaxID=2590999 RepID=A0A843YSK6_9BURK|nr:hypothetical protein [Glaciimonas soli]MQR00553.1 hypothetical protein [Glaciimonas soli]